ncbi:methyl-accepting chemotaxis protein [Hoeflea alexandrii]|uniref:methyl-accepting chemotaxis protein n=1 Tax=Hoeflea alexandrii TaxID=288436 RepID=UPI0022AF4DBB|nr:methyl-accepting chemotaxis protein [Hoeflea alexandrii]MCZ4287514.1 methyl-accepting chemotaxis protein [Hoeflea alexandrii]
MRITDLKLGRALPFAIAALIATNLAAIGYADYMIIDLAKSSHELASDTKTSDKLITELAVLTKGIELDIVSTQEALTDVSATRGMDGLDDGFALAEEAAQELSTKAQRVVEIGDSLNNPALRTAIKSLKEQYAVFLAAGIEMAQAYVAGGPAEGNKLMGSFDQVADNLQKEIEKSSTAVEAAQAQIEAETASRIETMNADADKSVVAGTVFAALALALGLALMVYVSRKVIRPLTDMKDYMGKLAAGDYSDEVPHAERKDEIGEMAQSVAYFREAAMERKSARARSEAEQAEIKRLEHEAAERQAAEDTERVRVIEALTTGLENLSSGNLAYRIDANFAPAYEKLRTEFNAAVGSLSETIDDISSTTEAVRLASSEIGAASDDLSKRTEQQAASLEETAAALDEITSTVKSSSQRAEEASQMVGAAKTGAEKSGAVVKNAISAMERIEESSKQISQIISVIDDIAFQTNLLALNAGVEAARAGEAGKGFAVVAQEVRELAGRSANAAKEIKTLIDTSSTQVGTGVTLVNQTGTALGEIESQVGKINELIQSIVTGAREQSTALAEINAAINQMDQTTQQNAAMVEETNAATQGLSSEAVKLEGLMRRFTTGGQPRRAPAVATPASRPAQYPARALGAKIASAFGRGGAATARKEESWSEF